MYNPNDEFGDTFESLEAERRNIIARYQIENDERELVLCAEADSYSALYPAQIEQPVAMAVAGWRRAIAIAERMAA